jgi:predicted RNA-binding Zn-ribbon protein involved in translation (DUF1610 family)
MVAGGHKAGNEMREERLDYPKTKRARPRRWYQNLPGWVGEYSVEIGLVIAVLAAIFLLVEPWAIRATLFRWVSRAYSGLSGSLGVFLRTIVDWARGLTLSDATAVGILLLVLLIAIWRARWRIIHNERFWSTSCPRCGLSELNRVRRNLTGRLLASVGFPVARYQCGNCAWTGLRIRKRQTSSPGFVDPPTG